MILKRCLSFFKNAPFFEALYFIPESWCFLDSFGHVTRHSDHFASCLKISSFSKPFFIWDLLAGVLKDEALFPLKEKFEKYTQQSSSFAFFEIGKKKEGGDFLVRLWRISENKYLFWLQEIERAARPFLIDASLAPAQQKINEPEKSKESAKQEIKALKKVFDGFSIAVSIFTKNKKLAYFNQAYVDLFQLDKDWLSKHPTFEEIFDELRNKRLLPEVLNFSSYKKKFLSFFEEEVSLQEETLHLPDERSLHLKMTPYALGGVVMLFENITERLVLERKNNTMIAVQNALADHLQDGIFIFGVDHRLTLMNAFSTQLWGVDAFFTEGEHLNQLINKTKNLFDYGKNWSLFKASILSGVAHRIQKKGVVHRKDGISLKFHYIPLPSGEHLITYQDVTDSFKFEEILEEATHLLETAYFIKDKILTITDQGLKNWTSHFSKFLQAFSKKVPTLNRLQKESLFELVHVFEDFKKAIHPTLGETASAPLFLNQMIEQTLQLFQGLIQEKNIRIFKSVSDNFSFFSNRKAAYQFFFSLVGYALQGCPEGEPLHISLHVFKNKVRLSLACRVELSTSRTPASSPYRNVALSLTLIKKLATLCAGDLKVASQNKKRLRLVCDFPLLESALIPSFGEGNAEILENLRQAACG